jgi:hypothetical protein
MYRNMNINENVDLVLGDDAGAGADICQTKKRLLFRY